MNVSFSKPSQETLRKIRREPGFQALTCIPTFAPQTIGLLALALSLFALATIAHLSGYLPASAMIAINSISVYLAFTPLHDATHRSVSANRRFNDWLGSIACQLLMPGMTTRVYRTLHLAHHRYTGEKGKDPDEAFVSARPLTLPVVIAFPEIKWAFWYARHWAARPLTERLAFAMGVIGNIAIHLLFLLSPYAWQFFIVWIIPQRIGLSLVTVFFARIQHPENVLWRDSPFQCAVRIVTRPFLDRIMLGQTLHIVHHLFPSVPFYRYRAAWNIGHHLLARENIPVRRFLARTTAPLH